MARQLILKWDIPPTVGKQLEKEIVSRTKEEVVLNLFKEKKLSLGSGAALLGLSTAGFMELLHEKGIPFTHYTEAEWKQDKRAVQSMLKERKAAGKP
ncbi:MAG: UPF0175 family protein [Candidatus Schekmanbacteria bacterium]|nr:UPF0175 family protein [Candidatus Schekmanbacteria bacterium]